MRKTLAPSPRLLLGFLALGAASSANGPLAAEPPSLGAAERVEVQASLAEATDKISALLGAIPAEKFDHRPSDKVRSLAQVAMHVVGANFFFSRALGRPLPADVSLRDLEKETDRAVILAWVRRSAEHAQQAITHCEPSVWEAKRDLGGASKTGRAVALQLAAHAHEHLGQLVAYARGAGITPPWSS